MKTKIMKAIALCLALVLCFGSAISVSAAEVADAPIDESQKGSLTIFKYDLTGSENAGIWDSSYVSTGVADESGVNETMKNYALEGVEYSFVKVADIVQFTESTADNRTDNHVEVLYAIDKVQGADFLKALGLENGAQRYTNADALDSAKYFYQSDVLIHALSAALTANSTVVKNAKLIALHDIDCPWRPSDLAQRLGRIVRQGNQNPEVEIFRYVTESTFDSYLYQLVENKQKFIAQIMTSKAPARIADDVDETALSYSEIKALATGNPLIIEKCNLDVEVSKLNMLKANHLNQRFALENLVLRKYPADIAKLTEAIAGYEKDVATAQAHPKPTEGFIGMEIKGTHYSEKEAAGKAVINACTELQGSDAISLGQYRGFSMSLQYDAAHTDYRLTMKGAMSHTISLGADVFGNITRMDNLVDGLAKELAEYQAALQDTHTQLANAKAEMETPFAKEAELAEKSARLKELNILLNMDQKDKALLDEAPEEDSPDKEKPRSVER